MKLLLSSAHIQEAVGRLASDLRRDYADKNLLLVGVLKGAFIFLADLVRALDIPLELDFIRLSSYGQGTETSGRIQVVADLKAPVAGRHVVVVEDIVDTGLTTSFLLERLRAQGAASVKLCALLDKAPRRMVPVPIDYLGLPVPDEFLVGYGLDYAERYRNLPDVWALEDNEK